MNDNLQSIIGKERVASWAKKGNKNVEKNIFLVLWGETAGSFWLQLS